MTFNLWVSGTNVQNGLQKVAKHIKSVDADIVALQEFQGANIPYLLGILNDSIWTACDTTNTKFDNDPYIITKLSIIRKFTPSPGFRNVGCQIQVHPKKSDMVLHFWNWHLPAYPYGPYDACLTRTATTEQELMQRETNGRDLLGFNRLNCLNTLLKHDEFILGMSKSHYEPVILAGDFNSPSHLDWVKSSAYLRNPECSNVSTFEWPVTKTLYDNGFLDSYRMIYPDPASHAGFTWSPIYTYNTENPTKLEPLDRIDMIMYKGSLLRPVSSRVYDGTSKIYHFPYHSSNDWPSDHSSVVTEFDMYAYN